MPIATNGWTICAPEGVTIEEICQEFETNEALWSKVTEHKIWGHSGEKPREWVMSHGPKDIRYAKGRDLEKVKQRNAEKIICECGRVVARRQLAEHKRTTAHSQAMT